MKTIDIKEMTTQDKYDYLIGMIEGCMEKDSDIVATEKLLDSLIQSIKKQTLFDYKKWYKNEYEGEPIIRAYFIDQFI